jgi:periplasmic protein TonB
MVFFLAIYYTVSSYYYMSSTSALPLLPLWQLSPESRAIIRRRLLYCAVISALVHAGIVWVGSTQAHARTAIAAARSPDFLPIVMPPLDPDPVEVTADPSNQTPLPVEPAPMQPDIPPITSSDFIQPPEPLMPQPDGRSDQNIIPPSSGPYIPLGRIYPVALLDKQPVAIVQAKPQYPFDMRRNGISGQAVVDFIVDAHGNVRNARVEDATAAEFGSSALAAVSKWHFKAGMKGGKAVATHMQVPVVFNIDDKE